MFSEVKDWLNIRQLNNPVRNRYRSANLVRINKNNCEDLLTLNSLITSFIIIIKGISIAKLKEAQVD